MKFLLGIGLFMLAFSPLLLYPLTVAVCRLLDWIVVRGEKPVLEREGKNRMQLY